MQGYTSPLQSSVQRYKTVEYHNRDLQLSHKFVATVESMKRFKRSYIPRGYKPHPSKTYASGVRGTRKQLSSINEALVSDIHEDWKRIMEEVTQLRATMSTSPRRLAFHVANTLIRTSRVCDNHGTLGRRSASEPRIRRETIEKRRARSRS